MEKKNFKSNKQTLPVDKETKLWKLIELILAVDSEDKDSWPSMRKMMISNRGVTGCHWHQPLASNLWEGGPGVLNRRTRSPG